MTQHDQESNSTGTGARPETSSAADCVLLDRISDHLEAAVNLAYLMEREPADSSDFREHCAQLTRQLSCVTAVTHGCLQAAYYRPGALHRQA